MWKIERYDAKTSYGEYTTIVTKCYMVKGTDFLWTSISTKQSSLGHRLKAHMVATIGSCISHGSIIPAV